MRNKMQLSFTDTQMEVIADFAKEVGLTVSDFCRKAVFYAINDATRRADELEQQQLDKARELKDGAYDTESAVSEGTDELQLPDTDSAALPNSSSDAVVPS